MKKSIFFAISGLLGILLLFLIDNVSFDNAKWLADDHAVEIDKKFVQDNFLDGEELVVIFDLNAPLFSREVIGPLTILDQKIKELEVSDVKTPVTSTIIISDEDNIILTDLTTAYGDGVIKDQFEAETELKSSLYYENLVNHDLTKILLTIRHILPEDSSKYEARKLLISRVIKEIEGYNFYDSYQLSGSTYLNFLVDDLNIKNLKLLLSIALILVFVFLVMIYRNITKVLLVTLSSIACLIYCLGLYYLFSEAITVINMVLPILIIVIALSDSIFITSRADLMIMRYQLKESFMLNLIKRTWLPCLLTSMTTAIGFGSFYWSQILPLKKLAMMAVPAILGSYIIIVLTNWLSIYLLSNELKRVKLLEKKRNQFLRVILRSSRRIVRNNAKRIIWGFSFIAIFFLCALLRIYTETNFLKIFFTDDKPIVEGFAILDQEFNGSSKIDIVFSDRDFEDIGVFEELLNYKEQLGYNQKIKHTISYHDVLQQLHSEFIKGEDFPKNSDQIGQEILFLEFSRSDNKDDVLEPYLNFTKTHSRMEFRTNNLSSKEIEILVSDIEEGLQDESGFFLSGDNYYFHNLSQYVVSTQIRSVFITFIFITILIFIIFGFRTALISVIPNFMPPIITLGTIALLGIPFDFSTILIAAISFGITVDSSIHLIHAYQDMEDQHFSSDKIRRHLLNTIGRPIVISAVIFSMMFLLFIFADLVLLVKFGLFSFLAIVISLLINLLLIPAILQLRSNNY